MSEEIAINRIKIWETHSKTDPFLKLDLSDLNLTTLPEYNYENVLNLDCSYNELVALPDLLNVQSLDCSNNQLIWLPKLPNVFCLACHWNRLLFLPELPKAEHIYAQFNPLISIPPVFPSVKIKWYANALLFDCQKLKWILN
jgi:Leucine-rich repeat (LRR) protein